jgi:hypothetical protein
MNHPSKPTPQDPRKQDEPERQPSQQQGRSNPHPDQQRADQYGAQKPALHSLQRS